MPPESGRACFHSRLCDCHSLIFLAPSRAPMCPLVTRSTAGSFQVMIIAYMTILITLYAFPFYAFDRGHKGCSLCSPKHLMSQPAHDDQPASTPYGILYNSQPFVPNPQPGRLDLAMSSAVEEWTRDLIAERLEQDIITIASTAILCMLPMPPLPTLALAFYFTYLRWFTNSSIIFWEFGGLSSSCCRLVHPLPFPFTPVLGAMLLYVLYRQASLLQICQLKRAQHQMALTRIDQLGEEKERLDYERALALKRIPTHQQANEQYPVPDAAEGLSTFQQVSEQYPAPDAAGLSTFQQVSEQYPAPDAAVSAQPEVSASTRAVELQLDGGHSVTHSSIASEPELGSVAAGLDASKDPRRVGTSNVVQPANRAAASCVATSQHASAVAATAILSQPRPTWFLPTNAVPGGGCTISLEPEQVGGEMVATLQTLPTAGWSTLQSVRLAATLRVPSGSGSIDSSDIASVDESRSDATCTPTAAAGQTSEARDVALTRLLDSMGIVFS